jgi:hypothetical protein
MNLIDSASLVVTPNAYKTSKLYSIVPTDGSGDFTFSRTGDTATRVNSAGLIESVLANRPRLDYLGSTCPKLLIEPQRTNLVTQSQDITSASWTKNNAPTIVGNVSVAPDGTTTADTFVDTTGGTFKDFNSGGSITAGQIVTLSFFIKKETTRTNFGGGRIAFFGGTSKSAWFYWNETTGQLLQSASSTITPTFKIEDYGTYWRFSVTATSETGHNFAGVYFYPTLSINGTSNGTGVGSVRTIWGIQLEVGSFSTSYISTTTASVTRNADSCTKTSISSLLGQTEGVIFCDVNLNSRLASTYFIIKGTSGNDINILINNTSIVGNVNNGGTAQAAITYTNSILGRFKIALAYKANDIALYINGTQIGTDSSATIPATTDIDLFNGATNSLSYNSVSLWKTKLTNQELATLTTL